MRIFFSRKIFKVLKYLQKRNRAKFFVIVKLMFETLKIEVKLCMALALVFFKNCFIGKGSVAKYS